MANLLIEIVHLLNQAGFVSGQQIGQKLGVSRSRVCQLIHQLQQSGLDIHAVRGRGYALQEKVILLNEQEIRKHLPNQQLVVKVVPRLDSTNTALLRQAKKHPQAQFLFAEVQTAGRGRRGRQWLAHFGGALTFSWLRPFSCALHQLGGLSLVAGLAVAQALQQYGVGVKLKWPNDIYLQQKKLGGILIDLLPCGKQQNCVITGIGLNFRLQNRLRQQIDQQVTDLYSLNPQLLAQRNQIAASIMQALIDNYQQFEQQGLTPFLGLWQQYDLLYQQKVNIEHQGEHYQAVAQGVTANGALKVSVQGREQHLYSGEASLRLSNHEAVS